MIRNYLKIALRNVRRHIGFTVLNVAGLAVALAVCLIIGLFIRHKLSFDRFHPHADRVHRVVYAETPFGLASSTTAPGIAAALEAQFPEVEVATVLTRPGEVLLSYEDQQFISSHVTAVDEKFLSVFPYRLLAGDPETAFSVADQIVLTEREARRIFGHENPVGKVLRYDARTDLTVSGIVEDPPSNAHFRFTALRPLPGGTMRAADPIDWNRFYGNVYLLLQPGAAPEALEAKIRAWEAAVRSGWGEGESFLALQPLTRIHLWENFEQDIAPQSDVRYLYLFGGIALIILLLACINYMNLATARSLRRAKEVGMRKVVGARRTQLVGQFLGESVLMVSVAVPLALGLAVLALPVMEQLAGEVMAPSLLDLQVLPVLVLVVLVVGIVAGSYPAFVLSRFRPSTVLYARGVMRQGGHGLRRALVVIQFGASVVLLIATLVIQAQLAYVQQAQLGFEEERLITMSNFDVLREQYGAFREALLQQSRVEAVTSAVKPGIGHMTSTRWIGAENDPDRWQLVQLNAGYDYVKTLGLVLMQGQDFDSGLLHEEEEVVLLNETAVRRFGLEGEATGQRIEVGEEPYRRSYRVGGVLADFHNRSLHDAVEPIAVIFDTSYDGTVLVRLRPGERGEALAQVEQVWKRFIPHRPFAFEFIDDRIQAQYLAEQRLGRIFGIFSGLAMLVACLGLFGLVALMAQQRTKEIGVRKVLGASVSGLVALLAKDFLKLVLVAFVLAAPLAYVLLQRWLEGFAYHVDLSPTIFLFSGLAVLGVAFLTVSYQAIRAAMADPVKSLRYE